MIEIGLRQLLLEQPSITHIAKPGRASDKHTYDAIFNDYTPEGFPTPFVLIRLIDNDPMGDLTETTGMEATTFEIDAYADEYVTSLKLSKAIRDFLKDYSGAAGGEDIIDAVLLQNTSRNDADENQGRDVRECVKTLTFLIQHHKYDE